MVWFQGQQENCPSTPSSLRRWCKAYLPLGPIKGGPFCPNHAPIFLLCVPSPNPGGREAPPALGLGGAAATRPLHLPPSFSTPSPQALAFRVEGRGCVLNCLHMNSQENRRNLCIHWKTPISQSPPMTWPFNFRSHWPWPLTGPAREHGSGIH